MDKKEKRENKDNNSEESIDSSIEANNKLIENPEFSFIFTVNLDGKLDIHKEIIDYVDNDLMELSRKKYDDRILREDFYNAKDPIFSKLLCACTSNKIKCSNNQKHEDAKSCFKYRSLSEKKELEHFIARAFIHKSVLSCWDFEPKNKELIIQDCYIKAVDRYLEQRKVSSKGQEKVKKITQKVKEIIISKGKNNNSESMGVNQTSKNETVQKTEELILNIVKRIQDLVSDFNAEIKLLSTGAVSIIIKSDHSTSNKNVEFSAKELIVDLLKHPNLSVSNAKYTILKNTKDGTIDIKPESDDPGSDSFSGLINIFTYEFASYVFNAFFRCMSNNSPQCLNIERIVKRPEPGRYNILNRFKRGLYTKKTIKVEVSKSPNLAQLSEQLSYVKGWGDYDKKHFLVYRGDIAGSAEKLGLLTQYQGDEDDLVSIIKMFSLLENTCKEKFDDFFESIKILLSFNLQMNNEEIDNIKGKCLDEHIGKLWDAPFFVFPYVTVKITKIPAGFLENGHITSEGVSAFVAIATHTYEFLNHLNIKEKRYDAIDKYSISSGTKDTIILTRRGLVAAGSREEKEGFELAGDNYPFPLDTPYNTLIFCLESVFATTKSVSSYNKELEEFISWRVGALLTLGSKIKFIKWSILAKKPKLFILFSLLILILTIYSIITSEIVPISIVLIWFFGYIAYLYYEYMKTSELTLLINKARTLSPCEDFSSNIAPSLKSEIAIRGIMLAKEFGLSNLIDTVHSRLENYGYFLKTCQEALVTKSQLAISVILIVIGALQLKSAFFPPTP